MLRWRPSRMGGRSIAAPAAAKERLRAAQQLVAARLETQGGGPCAADHAGAGSFCYDPQKGAIAIAAAALQQTGVDMKDKDSAT